jgi:hypothetical protein
MNVNIMCPVLAFDYILNPKFALGLSVGKGHLDFDSTSGKKKYNKNGGWTVVLLDILTYIKKSNMDLTLQKGLSKPKRIQIMI